MKQLTEKLYAVEIPTEYDKFKISGTGYLCGMKTSLNNVWFPLKSTLESTNNRFKILGVCTQSEIDFDCERYAKTLDSDLLEKGRFKEAFRSLLSKHAIIPTETTKILILEKL